MLEKSCIMCWNKKNNNKNKTASCLKNRSRYGGRAGSHQNPDHIPISTQCEHKLEAGVWCCIRSQSKLSCISFMHEAAALMTDSLTVWHTLRPKCTNPHIPTAQTLHIHTHTHTRSHFPAMCGGYSNWLQIDYRFPATSRTNTTSAVNTHSFPLFITCT